MSEADITVYGAPWCGDCRRSKLFLDRHRGPYEWVDVDEDPDGLEYIRQLNGGRRIIPTIVFQDGSILVEPSDEELGSKLGIGPKVKPEFQDASFAKNGGHAERGPGITPDTAKHEENRHGPAETQPRDGGVYAMAVGQFDAAAEKIGLDDATRRILSKPGRELTVNFR